MLVRPPAQFHLVAESGSLAQQDGRLDCVEPPVDAYTGVVVAAVLAVDADFAHQLGELHRRL